MTTVFKSIFVLLIGLLFTVTRAQTDTDNEIGVLKSLTAKCENTDTCTYSLGFFSTDPTKSYSADYNIKVDSVIATFGSVFVDFTSPKYVNFTVKMGDEIVIIVKTPNGPETFKLLKIFDQANGTGQVVKSSRSRYWFVPNNCKTTLCTLQLTRSSVWADNLSAKFIVNGQLAGKLTPSVNATSVDIAQGDALSLEIITYPLTSSIPDSVNVTIKLDGSNQFIWYSNSLTYPMTAVSTGCLPSIKSPFGSIFIVMNQEELDIYEEQLKTSFSGIWHPITNDN